MGFILFVPGSYHTVVAIMACKKMDGYSFKDVAVFDEHIFEED